MRHFRSVPITNLAGGHPGDAFVAANVVQQLFEVTNAVRYAGNVGVDRNRHDAGIVGTLGIQPVELVGAAGQKLVRPVTLQGINGDIIGFDGIGHCRDTAKGRRRCLWQVVQHPVRHIFDAGLAQQIKRGLCFRQARAFP